MKSTARVLSILLVLGAGTAAAVTPADGLYTITSTSGVLMPGPPPILVFEFLVENGDLISVSGHVEGSQCEKLAQLGVLPDLNLNRQRSDATTYMRASIKKLAEGHFLVTENITHDHNGNFHNIQAGNSRATYGELRFTDTTEASYTLISGFAYFTGEVRGEYLNAESCTVTDVFEVIYDGPLEG